LLGFHLSIFPALPALRLPSLPAGENLNIMSTNAKTQNAISPTRTEDFPEWYQQVIKASDLAENSEVRGCMVIKPWGYGIWELIQKQLDIHFKATGHQNAYFPLLIPLSYLEKEAAHVEGFAKECAVVTHHRLEAVKDADGKMRMVPSGELGEPYVIRPTSETIIGAAFARWVESYRDLPLLINQWANVMRWEMRPRIFLRTAEFLWQEGHTAHETKDEALTETEMMLQVYRQFAEEHLAIPVLTGEKSPRERFPGADSTLCIEAMVQDRKAIQAGTSHFLGQHFSEAANIQFTGRSGAKELAWTTSWGVSTRLIGTLIMAHSDDDGLVLPPRVAPQQIVIVPIINKEETKAQVLEAARSLAAQLRAQSFHGDAIRVHVDERDVAGGTKNWEWIKKGVPIRIELGPRDVEKGTAALARRDQGHKDKSFPAMTELVTNIASTLQSIQDNLLEKARTFRDANMVKIETKAEFEAFFTAKNPDKPEIHGGFALVHWAGNADDEDNLQKTLGVTMRCIPRGEEFLEKGICPFTGGESAQRVVFSKAY
jgi:prolyl-tRNA synthetase